MNNLPVKIRIAQLRHRNSVGPDVTRKKIIDSFGKSISGDVHKVSLICPISKTRIVTPVRSQECKHLQCFDAESYHALYKGYALYAKPWVWKCPICLLKAPFSFLIVDSLFTEILDSKDLPGNSTDVVFKPDGSWTPDVIETPEISCIDISDDDDKEENKSAPEKLTDPTPPKPDTKVDVIKTFRPRSIIVVPPRKTTSSPPRRRSPSRNQAGPRRRRSPQRSSAREQQHYRNPYRVDHRRHNESKYGSRRVPDQNLQSPSSNRVDQQTGNLTSSSRETSNSSTTRDGLQDHIRSSIFRGAAAFNTNPWEPFGSASGDGHQGGGPLRREHQSTRSHYDNPYERPQQRYVVIPRSPFTLFLRGFPPYIYPFEIHRFLSGFGVLSHFGFIGQIGTAFFVFSSEKPERMVQQLHGLFWCGYVLEAGRSYAPNFQTNIVYY